MYTKKGIPKKKKRGKRATLNGEVKNIRHDVVERKNTFLKHEVQALSLCCDMETLDSVVPKWEITRSFYLCLKQGHRIV